MGSRERNLFFRGEGLEVFLQTLLSMKAYGIIYRALGAHLSQGYFVISLGLFHPLKGYRLHRALFPS